MPRQGRTSQLPDLFPVHLGNSAVVFGVGITGCASMLAEESCLENKERKSVLQGILPKAIKALPL